MQTALSTPERHRTSRSSQDEILRVAAVDAALAVLSPSALAMLTAHDLHCLSREIDCDVQSGRLRRYAL